MYQTRKIGVVGQGHVGAHVANSLLMQGIADELYLCDINEAKVTSEVQDLRDSLSFVPYNTKIVNCYDRYEELACCDVIVNAAGKVALAAGNRDGELFFTTDAARSFAKRIVDAGFDGIFVSISNPCDVVCTELWHLTGYDPKKIIGSGCGLDSARLRTEISKKGTLFSSNSSLGRHSAKRSFISLAQMVLSDGFDAMSFACFMST